MSEILHGLIRPKGSAMSKQLSGVTILFDEARSYADTPAVLIPLTDAALEELATRIDFAYSESLMKRIKLSKALRAALAKPEAT